MLLEDDLHAAAKTDTTRPQPRPSRTTVPTIPEPIGYQIKNKVLGPPLHSHRLEHPGVHPRRGETGSITVVFFGRREVGGVRLSMIMSVTGVAGEHHGMRAVLNLEYAIISTPTAPVKPDQHDQAKRTDKRAGSSDPEARYEISGRAGYFVTGLDRS